MAGTYDDILGAKPGTYDDILARPKDPMSGRTGMQNFLAGAGKAVADTGFGLDNEGAPLTENLDGEHRFFVVEGEAHGGVGLAHDFISK